ncbi:restriction endonuclease subunit S [Aeromonas hydrophila]|uniref:restriction endonuclease subunit S n=1 Tax=Aeromonas hydrophila TaxID=644 RepID=UPI003EC52F4B
MSSKWPVLPLEECLDALIDYRGKTPEKTDSGIPLVTAKVIKGGRIETPNEFIAHDDYESWMRRGIPEAGDVVMTTEAPLGEVAQLGKEKVALAQRVITLRGKSGFLDNAYLLYLLQTEEMQEQLKARATGTTVLGIKQSELRKVDVRVPPFNLQQSAAITLKALDDRITLLRETNTTLEAIAQALFKSWFVDFDPVHARARGEQPAGLSPEVAALFPDSFEDSELGMVPKGWRVGAFGDVCARIESGGTPKRSVPEYWGGGVPWLSSGEVRNPIVFDTKETITDLGVRESAAKLWPQGTTVVAMYGATAGEVCLLAKPTTANQACCGLIPKSQTRAFMFMCARRERVALASKSSGSAQQNLNKGLIESHSLVLPPNEVLNAYEESAGALLDCWIANAQQAQTLAALRDTLLPRLISGQLRLPEAEAMVREAQK